VAARARTLPRRTTAGSRSPFPAWGPSPCSRWELPVGWPARRSAPWTTCSASLARRPA